MKQVIEYIRDKTYFRVKPSLIEGVGLFSIRDIKKGTNILEEYPHKFFGPIPLNEIKDFHSGVIESLNSFYSNDGKDIYIRLFPYMKIAMCDFINHSDINNVRYIMKEPTCSVDGESWCEVELHTIRNIKQGEEILLNYKHPSMSRFYNNEI